VSVWFVQPTKMGGCEHVMSVMSDDLIIYNEQERMC